MLEIYLLGINIIGFVLFAIDMYFYNHSSDQHSEKIDKAVTMVSLLGGSLGVLISIFVFCRCLKKSIMMSRVFAICVFIIELVRCYTRIYTFSLSQSFQAVLSETVNVHAGLERTERCFREEKHVKSLMRHSLADSDLSVLVC